MAPPHIFLLGNSHFHSLIVDSYGSAYGQKLHLRLESDHNLA